MFSRKKWRSSPKAVLFVVYSITCSCLIDALPLTVKEETRGLIHGTQNGVLCDILDLISLAPKDGVGLMTAKQLRDLFCQNRTRSALQQPLEDSPTSKPSSYDESLPTTQTYGPNSAIHASQSTIHPAKSTDLDPFSSFASTLNVKTTTVGYVSTHASDEEAHSKVSQPGTNKDPFDSVNSITTLSLNPEVTTKIPEKDSNSIVTAPSSSSTSIIDPLFDGTLLDTAKSSTVPGSIDKATSESSENGSSPPGEVHLPISVDQNLGGNGSEAQNNIQIPKVQLTDVANSESDVIDVIGTTTEFHEQSEDANTVLPVEISYPTPERETEDEVVINLNTNVTFSDMLNSSQTDLSLKLSNSSETSEVKIHATIHLTDLTFEIPEDSVESTTEIETVTQPRPQPEHTTISNLEVEPTPTTEIYNFIPVQNNINGEVGAVTVVKESNQDLRTTEPPPEGTTKSTIDHPTHFEMSNSPSVLVENTEGQSSTHQSIENTTDELTTPVGAFDNNKLTTAPGGTSEEVHEKVSESTNSDDVLRDLTTTETSYERNASTEFKDESVVGFTASAPISTSNVHYGSGLNTNPKTATSEDSKSLTTVTHEDYQNTTEQDQSVTTNFKDDETLVPTTTSSNDISRHLETTPEYDSPPITTSIPTETAMKIITDHTTSSPETDGHVEFTEISKTTVATKLYSDAIDHTPELTTADFSSEVSESYSTGSPSFVSILSTSLGSDVTTTSSTSYNTEVQTTPERGGVDEITSAIDTTKTSVPTELTTARPSIHDSVTESTVFSTAPSITNEDEIIDVLPEVTTVKNIDTEEEFKPVTELDEDIRTTLVSVKVDNVEEKTVSTPTNEKSSESTDEPMIIFIDTPTTSLDETSTVLSMSDSSHQSSISGSDHTLPEELTTATNIRPIDLEGNRFSVDSTSTESLVGTTVERENETKASSTAEIDKPTIGTEQNYPHEETFELSTTESSTETVEGSGNGQLIEGNDDDTSTHSSLEEITFVDELTTSKPQLTSKPPVIISDDHSESYSVSSEKSSAFDPTTPYPDLEVELSTTTQQVFQTSSPIHDFAVSSNNADHSTTVPSMDPITETIVSSTNSKHFYERTTQNPEEKFTTVINDENTEINAESKSTERGQWAEITTQSAIYVEQVTTEESESNAGVVPTQTEEPGIYGQESVTPRDDDKNSGHGTVDLESSSTKLYESSSDSTTHQGVVSEETTPYQQETSDRTEKYSSSPQNVEGETESEDNPPESTYHTTSMYVTSDKQYQLPSDVTEKTKLSTNDINEPTGGQNEYTTSGIDRGTTPAIDAGTTTTNEEYKSSEGVTEKSSEGVNEEFTSGVFPTTQAMEVPTQNETVSDFATEIVQYTTSAVDLEAGKSNSENHVETDRTTKEQNPTTEMPTESIKSPNTYWNSLTTVKSGTNSEKSMTTTGLPDTTILIQNGSHVRFTDDYKTPVETVTEGIELNYETKNPNSYSSHQTTEYGTIIDHQGTTASFEIERVESDEVTTQESTDIPTTVAGLNMPSESSKAPEQTLASQPVVENHTDHIAQDFTTEFMPIVSTIRTIYDGTTEASSSSGLASGNSPTKGEQTTESEDSITTERLSPEIVTDKSLDPSLITVHKTPPARDSYITEISHIDETVRPLEEVELTTQMIKQGTTPQNLVSSTIKDETNTHINLTLPEIESNAPHISELFIGAQTTTNDHRADVTERSSGEQTSSSSSHESHIKTDTSFVTQTSMSADSNNSTDQVTENMGNNSISLTQTLSEVTAPKYESGKEQDDTSKSTSYSSTSTQNPKESNDILRVDSKTENDPTSHNPKFLVNELVEQTTKSNQSTKLDQFAGDSDQSRVSLPQYPALEPIRIGTVDSQPPVNSVSNSVHQSDVGNEVHPSESPKGQHDPNTRTNSIDNEPKIMKNSYAEQYSSPFTSNMSFPSNTIVGAAPSISSDSVHLEPISEGELQKGKSSSKLKTDLDSFANVSVIDSQDEHVEKNVNKKPSDSSTTANKTSSQTTERPKKTVPQNDSNCLVVGNVQVCVNEPIANYLDVEEE